MGQSRAVKMMMSKAHRKIAGKQREQEQYEEQKQKLYDAAKRIFKDCRHTADTTMGTMMFHLNRIGEPQVRKLAERNLSGFLFRKALRDDMEKAVKMAAPEPIKDTDHLVGSVEENLNG